MTCFAKHMYDYGGMIQPPRKRGKIEVNTENANPNRLHESM